MIDSKPLILISNDDGYQAKGINFLISTLRPIANLFVVAPDSGRSGAGCSLSPLTPLKYKKIKEEEDLVIYACNGTPVDCVKMAFYLLGDKLPKMVITGINHGDNASVNAHYSGTMGAAFEGAMKGIPAMAFSLCDHKSNADFTPLAPYIVDMTKRVLSEGMPANTLINVNFPLASSFKGVKVCRMAFNRWENELFECQHPYGPNYFWLVGNVHQLEPEATDTDTWALENGYVAVTPTQVDVTSYKLLHQIKNWELAFK